MKFSIPFESKMHRIIFVNISIRNNYIVFIQDFISMLIRECNHELSKFPSIVSSMQELQRRKEVKQEIEEHKKGGPLLLPPLRLVILCYMLCDTGITTSVMK